MLFVFDLDGTLIDNYDAVLLSYREAGVEPPADFFEKPSHLWKNPPTEKQKEAKQHNYIRNISRCKRGPALVLWHALPQDTRMILTGASYEAAQLATSVLGIISTYAICGKSLEEKIHVLQKLRDFHGEREVFYVDADTFNAQRVAHGAGITGITFFEKDMHRL